MSKLRKLTSIEIRQRMTALRSCIKRFNKTSVAKTDLWLVSVEKFRDGKFKNIGIPIDVMRNSKGWANMGKLQTFIEDNYYQYIFVTCTKDENLESRNWSIGQPVNQVKRRLLKCNDVYVCRVSGELISSCKVIKGGNII